MRPINAALAAVLGLLAPASALAAQVFTFDDSNVTAGNFAYAFTPGFTPAAGESFSQNAGIATDGSAFGFNFAGDGTPATAFLQTATAGLQGSFVLTLSGLTAGQAYSVDFLDESRGAQNGGTAYTVTYGSHVFNFGVPTSTTVFTPESFTFVADSLDTSLTFAAPVADGTFDRSTAIDTVSVAPVPEPAAWALIVTGFAGLGGALRGRRKGVALAA